VVSLLSEEAALLGDAIIGGVAAGIFDSLAEGTQRMVVLTNRTEPGPDVAVYKALYAHYCDLDDTLDQFFRRSSSNS
jgi:ribulose kinase